MGLIRHSSCVRTLFPGAWSRTLKWAHLAGMSKAMGYSVGLALIIFSFWVAFLVWRLKALERCGFSNGEVHA